MPEIERYSLDQITLYQREAQFGRYERARLALIVARGAGAKTKDYKQLMKELENAGKGHDPACH